MSEKFRNKYRIESTRFQKWDYGSNAAYFVTICTKNRMHYFGEIVETQYFASQQPNINVDTQVETQYFASQPRQSISSKFQMQLSEIGKIANENWLSIPEHFPFVKLGNHVIMSNHVHGIIIIDKPNDTVETQDFASQQQQPNKFGPQSKNLASIIRGYKSSVKKYGTMHNIDFVWQPLFHNHIIRNEISFQRISEYILNNPMHWKKDQFHK